LTDRSLVSFMISISLTTIIAAVGIATLQDHTALAGTFPGPNGKIAFESTRDGNDEIYVMNADGTGQTRLTNNAAHDFRPSWSPNGSKIAFASTRDGNNEIYVMNADGTGQTRLTNNAAFDSRPSWSPNGSKIAFASTRDGKDQIYVMNADGTGQTRLTNNAAHDFRPSWSPNGSKIAFVSDRDGNFEIYVMNADGTGQTNLSNSFPQDSEPDWGTLQGIICPGPGPATVGAEILPVDSTALLIAGASANAYWMLPTSVAVIGAIVGVFLIRRVDVSR